MALDIRTASLVEFLPESIAADEEILALSLALDPELRAVGAAIVEAIILPRLDVYPTESDGITTRVLDEIAWSMRLNELWLWDDATPAAKRAILTGILKLRKKSGTRYAVRRMFELLSVDADIVEWWEEVPSPADPYTYRVTLNAGEEPLTLRQLQQIPTLTRRFAPTRSYLWKLSIAIARTAPVVVYPALTSGMLITIGAP